ncbi:MAG: 4-amino-4-deoxychorismate lyase [Akkermansiaceae bacterium]|nr:4-amino-4-deoxychorismate lyase [Akkermansiaceae bacterium]NNM29457.1 4-amino-4-deoxychorismate lyase [Akkermansiaceae bacterium]
MQVWINESMHPVEEAAISAFDHGVTVGDGVFETMVSYAGEPFAFTRHHRRLERSAQVMGLPAPGAGPMREASRAVLAANGLLGVRARVRITVTGGPAPLGSVRGDEGTTIIVAAAPVAGPADTAAVQVVPFTRNETGALAGAKTTSYGENVVALAYATDLGADEAIFANTKGELCEGTGTNVFLVLAGALLTPPLEGGCLPGVTRALVLELCAREGIAVSEEAVAVGRLAEAEEAFLTSTTREVQPIREVDGNPLAAAPGALTGTLRAAFRALADGNVDP